MPAQVELFNAVTQPAEIVYIETSFLFELIRYISAPSEPRRKACKEFYDKMKANGTTMWTSYWSIQEILWKILRDKIHQAIRTYEADNNLPRNRINYGRFKRFYQVEYNTAYTGCRSTIERICQNLLSMDLNIMTPKHYQIIRKGRLITQYARALLRNYVLEPADAFHIAIARCEGIKYIVSNDHYFQNVDEINVYAYSSASP